jgi:hypothetical protein
MRPSPSSRARAEKSASVGVRPRNMYIIENSCGAYDTTWYGNKKIYRFGYYVSGVFFGEGGGRGGVVGEVG